MKKETLLILFSILLLISLVQSKKKKSGDKNKELLDEEDDEEIVKKGKDTQFNELLSISRKNFKEFTSRTEKFFILFHNPWCKFSQNFEKKLSNVAGSLKTLTNPFYIGAVDCTLEDCNVIVSENIPSEIMSSHFTYPKLVYFLNGKAIEVYNGKHNKNDIYMYIKRKLITESVYLTQFSNYENKIAHEKHTFIFVGDYSNERRYSYGVYNLVAKNETKAVFYHTDDEELSHKLSPNDEDGIIYLSFGKQKDVLTLNKDITIDSFNKFIKKNTQINLYEKLTEEAINEIIMKKQNAMILFRDVYDNKTIFLEENFPLLSKSQPLLKFVITDLTGKYEYKLGKLMDVVKLPALRIIDFRQGAMRKYDLSRELTMENVLGFIKMWKDNRTYPYVSTYPDAEDKKYDSLVKRLNNNNFYNSVLYQKKNAVVLFYTNWCSHCKKVIPAYEVAAKRFNQNAVTFYMVDIEEHDLSNFTKEKIQIVPSIFLYPMK
jgi:hypothetical protein